MHAFNLTDHSLASLKRVDMPMPSPEPDEVLIRLHAASLNYLDLMVAWGRLGSRSTPFIPGTDGAGEIVEIGNRVEGWAVGDRVVPGRWSTGPPDR